MNFVNRLKTFLGNYPLLRFRLALLFYRPELSRVPSRNLRGWPAALLMLHQSLFAFRRQKYVHVGSGLKDRPQPWIHSFVNPLFQVYSGVQEEDNFIHSPALCLKDIEET